MTEERKQLTDAHGKAWYTVVYPSFAERSFTAEDDDEAIAITENLAHEAEQTVTLYRTLRMRKLEKVCQVLPDRGF
jgi:hypothetical protein